MGKHWNFYFKRQNPCIVGIYSHFLKKVKAFQYYWSFARWCQLYYNLSIILTYWRSLKDTVAELKIHLFAIICSKLKVIYETMDLHAETSFAFYIQLITLKFFKLQQCFTPFWKPLTLFGSDGEGQECFCMVVYRFI